MQKQIITSAIALTLFGCGGGESGNSGNPTPPVKNYTIDFLGTDLQATTGNCQVFGYGPEKENGERERVIAFKTQPSTSRYEVFIHNADGTVRQHFRGSDLNTQQLRFAQNKIPNDGYLSFAYFQSEQAQIVPISLLLQNPYYQIHFQSKLVSIEEVIRV